MKKASHVVVLLWAASQVSIAGEPPVTAVTVSGAVPVDQSACLVHSVKELGMSAKRIEPERRWSIKPQFLHPSLVPDGQIEIELSSHAESTRATVTARWPGPQKEAAMQAEIEERLRAMIEKMTQLCGVTRAPLRCEVATTGTPSAACRSK